MGNIVPALQFKRFAGTVVLASSGYNSEFVDRMRADFLDKMKSEGVVSERLMEFCVPGALELPQALLVYGAKCVNLSVMVALGCVIRGGTYHYEIVCENSARGLMLVALQTRIPVINGILTCKNMRQAKKRAQSKGVEFACAASQMAALHERA